MDLKNSITIEMTLFMAYSYKSCTTIWQHNLKGQMEMIILPIFVNSDVYIIVTVVSVIPIIFFRRNNPEMIFLI
jgi:hypothetical protein